MPVTLALVTLALSMLAAPDDCVVHSRSASPDGKRAYVVRSCVREVEPYARIPGGMLAEYEAEGINPFLHVVVEYGVVEDGVDLWIADSWLGRQPEPMFDFAAELSPACRDEDALFAVWGTERADRGLRKTVRVRECIVGVVARALAWSADGTYLALRYPKWNSTRDDEIVDSETGATIIAVDSFHQFHGASVVSVRQRWPRGCRPLDVDELNAKPYPMFCVAQTDERVALDARVDLATSQLLEVQVPVVKPSRTTRDPFSR